MNNREYDIRSIFLKMELDLIVALKNEMKRDSKLVDENGQEYKSWHELRLRSLESLRKTNKFIIKKYESDIESLIHETLLESYKLSQKNFNEVIQVATEPVIQFPKDLAQWEKVEMELDFFRVNDNKFDALVETIDSDMDNALLSVQRKMDDVYRQTLFKTQVEFNAGHVTLQQAVDNSTKEFLSKGIDSIVYKDGTKVNITSYVDMALRTANHRAYLMGEGKKRREMGLSLVVVSAHATACDLCVPWQGKILIDDVYSGGTKEDGPYPLLSEAIKQGLLHPNCRHNLSTYFEGITTLPTITVTEDVKANYKAEQQQRYIERQIRKYKRLAAGTIEDSKVEFYDNKVKQWQAVMREHLKDNTQLRRNYHREKIY